MAELVKENDYIGYFIDEEIDDFGLVRLDLKEKLPINSIGVIYPKNTINSVARHFIDSIFSDKEEVK